MKKETLKSKVEYILSTIPETRNDDTLLALQVWHSLRSDLFLSLEGREGLYIRAKDLLDHLPNHDNISRIRRKFQEEGKYVATDPEVFRQRQKSIDKWVDFTRNFI